MRPPSEPTKQVRRIIMHRHGHTQSGDGSDGSAPSEAWLFLQAIRSNPIPKIVNPETKAKADREELERLAQFSSNHAEALRRLDAAEAEARHERELLEWAAKISANSESKLYALQRQEAAEREAWRARKTLPNGCVRAPMIQASTHAPPKDSPMAVNGLQTAAQLPRILPQGNPQVLPMSLRRSPIAQRVPPGKHRRETARQLVGAARGKPPPPPRHTPAQPVFPYI